MFRKSIILGMLLLITTAVFSQRSERKKEMMEKLEAQKIAFITTELDLSSEEAQDFWPVYNEYQNKLKAFREEQKDQRPNVRPEEITEEDAKSIIDSRFNYEEKELALRREYMDKISNEISMVKVAKLLMLEREFKSKMMEKIRKSYKSRKGDREPRERMGRKDNRN